MNNIRFIASIIFFSFFGTVLNAGNIKIIPKPKYVQEFDGKSFILDEKVNLYYAPSVLSQANYLSEILGSSTGYKLKLVQGPGRKGIILAIDSIKVSAKEAYELEVKQSSIKITGHDNSGVFYGIQTLLQLLPEQIYSNKTVSGVTWKVPTVLVKDAPERPWRGMMLDVARYFYDKEFVKKYIDMMAMYKLNKFQFHFIDDSGWRLEIKKYPLLTKVGAWADVPDGKLGGYYTQDDIKEIIEYASVRGVEVIPEIEFPAHMLSAVAAYPWLACSGQPRKVPSRHFISRDLICVGNEASMKFLEDVLEETVNLFPSKYINIGGDEAVYTEWEKCPKCRKVMQDNNLEKVSDLQGYLTDKVALMLRKKGRTVVGWEEIIGRGEVHTPVVSLVWHNSDDTLMAKRTGHKAVLIPATNMYFDFPESSTPGEVRGATWMPPVSLEKAYSLSVNDFSDSSVTLGVQGAFWSDQFIHGTTLQEIPYLNENRSEQYAEYFTFPRLLALSEVAWCSTKDKDFKDFRDRLSFHYSKLEQKDCNFRVPEPIADSIYEENGKTIFSLHTPIEGRHIRYTVDGSFPDSRSAIYSGPVAVDRKSDFKAVTFASDKHFSLPLYLAPDYSEFAEYGDFTFGWDESCVRRGASALNFDCSGKIISDGSYSLSLVFIDGTSELSVKSIKIFKRDMEIAEIRTDIRLSYENRISTVEIPVSGFEAGTPISVEMEIVSDKGNNSKGYIFIKKN